ncbi:MAG: hypothetical protein JWR75_1509 [Devosia sp.]|nr:hypothetical protein [Devosia sp.]
MLRHLAFAAIGSLAFAGTLSSAFAQDVPAEGYKSLWCGQAFLAAAGTLPAEATDQDKQTAQYFIDSGNGLIETGLAAYVTAGFTEEAAAAASTALAPTVSEQISANNGEGAEFTFDDCSVLIPVPAEMPATAPADAPATAPTEAPATAPADAPAPAPTEAPAAAPAVTP